jgi:hypothetical protein
MSASVCAGKGRALLRVLEWGWRGLLEAVGCG